MYDDMGNRENVLYIFVQQTIWNFIQEQSVSKPATKIWHVFVMLLAKKSYTYMQRNFLCCPHYQKLVRKWPPLAWQFAYDTYAMAFDFYREIHRTRTFFRKLQQSNSYNYHSLPPSIDQQSSHFPTFW